MDIILIQSILARCFRSVVTSGRGTALKITLENWPHVQKKLREVGIENAEYDSKGGLRAVVTKDGQRFEFPAEAVERFKNSGLLRLGRRIKPRT